MIDLISESETDQIRQFKFDEDDFPRRFEFKFVDSQQKVISLDCSTSRIKYNDKNSLLLIIRDITEIKNREKANYQIAISAEEKERARLSKELHDGLGPLLSALKIYLDILYTSPNDKEVIKRINFTLDESIKTVKEISNNLSPYILENMGLTKALESFIERIKFKTDIKISYKSNIIQRLNSDIEISVYRFVSELINNTLKHAQANSVEILLQQTAETINIVYADDGVGFDYSDQKIARKGIGLYNLKSRIENIGGTVKIKTALGKGVKVEAIIYL